MWRWSDFIVNTEASGMTEEKERGRWRGWELKEEKYTGLHHFLLHIQFNLLLIFAKYASERERKRKLDIKIHRFKWKLSKRKWSIWSTTFNPFWIDIDYKMVNNEKQPRWQWSKSCCCCCCYCRYFIQLMYILCGGFTMAKKRMRTQIVFNFFQLIQNKWIKESKRKRKEECKRTTSQMFASRTVKNVLVEVIQHTA